MTDNKPNTDPVLESMMYAFRLLDEALEPHNEEGGR